MEQTLETAIARPRYQASDDAGFNGQPARKRLYRALLEAFDFELMVETGTWTGDTTGYLAETSGVPVFSSEINYRFHSLARKRLVDFPSVSLHLSDSRRFLSELAANPDFARRRTFFYLDAHWYNDLPLREEIGIIADAWPEFVIMVDDFQVPGDDGYGYDDYGPGQALTIDYITGTMIDKGLAAFFPFASSHDETGYHKRGCVVIAREGDGGVLDMISELRR